MFIFGHVMTIPLNLWVLPIFSHVVILTFGLQIFRNLSHCPIKCFLLMKIAFKWRYGSIIAFLQW